MYGCCNRLPGGHMQIQVGRFVCTLSIDDRGEMEAKWLPWRPKYLNKDERAQYLVGRAAFLKRANPRSIVDVVDRLSDTDSRMSSRPTIHQSSSSSSAG
jgi:hypothetical protein